MNSQDNRLTFLTRLILKRQRNWSWNFTKIYFHGFSCASKLDLLKFCRQLVTVRYFYFSKCIFPSQTSARYVRDHRRIRMRSVGENRPHFCARQSHMCVPSRRLNCLQTWHLRPAVIWRPSLKPAKQHPPLHNSIKIQRKNTNSTHVGQNFVNALKQLENSIKIWSECNLAQFLLPWTSAHCTAVLWPSMNQRTLYYSTVALHATSAHCTAVLWLIFSPQKNQSK